MPNDNARGDFLEALRLSRRLTQMQVAEAIGVSQAALSKAESGAELDDEKWVQLADLLGVPVEAFFRVTSSAAPARIFHRKLKSTPKTSLNKIAADLALVRLRVKNLLGRQPTTLHRHELEDGFVTPQEVAQRVRDELQLGTDPIDDLVAVLEDAGAVVLRWPLESIRVDAVASWQEDEIPVILIGEHVPADRQRFTMAHELGHAVMHETEATPEQEGEADAFAGEFLLPAARLLKDWPSLVTFEALMSLKRKWGLSLSALIRRGLDAGLLSEADYRTWSIRLSTTGMHRQEPEPSRRENPVALASAIQNFLNAGASVEDLASRAYMYPREFELTFLQEIS
ncbi:XRE family transcriptional regulator [Leifsonia sp. LS1]|uniref:helix-turn-helix domain-containing protein n=1 Tax=Leifsonia sp. LS1 TaxID=2828483 RepID=UPI001CFD29A5|nr:XRE family transcriptional regulator [Leifsonia sp. LS1]GIT78497.1 XRE family transcriptional regulator [Leifsonia sp. LS1]